MRGYGWRAYPNDRAAPPRRDPGGRCGRLLEARRQRRGGNAGQLQALRTDVIEPAIAKHAGRLFKAVGDGFLVEFASAVQAVEAARAIQQANAEGNCRCASASMSATSLCRAMT